MERQIQDGPCSWAVWQEALRETEWAGLVARIITADALQEELQFTDLRRVLDGMWVRELERQQVELSRRAASDPAALQAWRDVEEHRRSRLNALSPAPRPLT